MKPIIHVYRAILEYQYPFRCLFANLKKKCKHHADNGNDSTVSILKYFFLLWQYKPTCSN